MTLELAGQIVYIANENPNNILNPATRGNTEMLFEAGLELAVVMMDREREISKERKVRCQPTVKKGRKIQDSLVFQSANAISIVIMRINLLLTLLHLIRM